MKTARTLIIIALLFTSVTLFAQIGNRSLMKVNIPFSFTVDNQTMPAGQYFVMDVVSERTIALTTADHRRTVLVNDLPNYATNASPDSRLVFHKYGNEYFLAQVWCNGDDVVRNPMISKRQVELAQSAVRPVSTVILADASH